MLLARLQCSGQESEIFKVHNLALSCPVSWSAAVQDLKHCLNVPDWLLFCEGNVLQGRARKKLLAKYKDHVTKLLEQVEQS